MKTGKALQGSALEVNFKNSSNINKQASGRQGGRDPSGRDQTDAHPGTCKSISTAQGQVQARRVGDVAEGLSRGQTLGIRQGHLRFPARRVGAFKPRLPQ